MLPPAADGVTYVTGSSFEDALRAAGAACALVDAVVAASRAQQAQQHMASSASAPAPPTPGMPPSVGAASPPASSAGAPGAGTAAFSICRPPGHHATADTPAQAIEDLRQDWATQRAQRWITSLDPVEEARRRVVELRKDLHDSQEDLANEFKSVGKDSIGSRLGKLLGGWGGLGSRLHSLQGVKQANEDIRHLDEALAKLVAKHPEEAHKLLGRLTTDMARYGLEVFPSGPEPSPTGA